MNVGTLDTFVQLANVTTTTPDSDGLYRDLQPAGVWAAIETMAAQNTGDRVIQHLVRMRFHAQVGYETKVTYTDRRGTVHELYVKGFQNVLQKDDELRLVCEEAV